MNRYGRFLPVLTAFFITGLFSTYAYSAGALLYSDDFESGLGNWSNVSVGDNKQWTRDSAGTPSSGTGPKSGANGSIYYVYMETSSGSAYTAGDTAILQGPNISGTGIQLSFHYHMYGGNTGTLAVDILSNGSWINDVWTKTGQQHTSNSDAYTAADVDLSSYAVSQIRFRATAAGGFTGDIAIDEINITSTPAGPVAPVFSSDPLDKPDGRQDQPYTDSIAANASDVNGDAISFSKLSGPAWLNISSTGVLSGTPSAVDVGMNTFTFEASDGVLSSTTTLNINVIDSSTPIVLFNDDFELGLGNWANATTGDNKNWTRDSAGTSSSGTGPLKGADGSSYYMYLETSSGFAYTAGDTAILLGPGLSHSGIHLSFQYHMYGLNTGTLAVDVLSGGSWINDVWTLSGQQHTSNGAPYTKVDIDLSSYAVSQIRFRAIAAGGYTGDMAIDNVQIINASTGPVAPAFNADPLEKTDATQEQPYTDSITADASDTNGDPMVFSKVSGPAWLNISAAGDLSGTPQAGDVGLNTFTVEVSDGTLASTTTLTINVKNNLTPTVLFSDGFESGLGNWTNVSLGDNKDWIRDSAGTTSSGTGPVSGADGSTYYMYLETSSGYAYTAGDTAILQGPVISDSNILLSFKYHMYGSNIGKLSVDVLSSGNWINDVWMISGQQQTSNAAAYTAVDVDLSSYSVSQIRLRATAAGSYMGDIAVDDLEISTLTNPGDSDGDGVSNVLDLCPNTPMGEAVDAKGCSSSQIDSDRDGVVDSLDAFPNNPTEWTDTDADGIGNNSDSDDDNDGVLDSVDAFPLNAAEWMDTDGDGIGNNADTDDDNDGVADISDAFPLNAAEWMDTDGDGIGNNTDTDDDNDGTLDINDDLPLNPNETIDTDGDGIGNNADTDDDGDGVVDSNDAFPLNANEWVDTDLDGIGNNADTDDDNDGVLDINDDLPLNPNESIDTDGDGIGNNADTDDDGDGVDDANDLYPLDPSESTDSDNDGIGNNADPDDDNDLMPDAFENLHDGLDPLVADGNGDLDGDGVSNLDEYLSGTNPSGTGPFAYSVIGLGYVYKINLYDGQTKLLGTIEKSGFISPSGVAISPMGILYVVDTITDSLYSVNTANGRSNFVASLTQDVERVGLSFDDNGTLWMVSDNARLYSINPQTGVTTDHGYHGVANIDSLAWDGNTLYGIASNAQNEVYSLNRSTAVASLVGSLVNINVSQQSGLTFQASGRLWGVERFGDIFTVDGQTGEATFRASVDDTSLSFTSLAMIFDSDADGIPDGWEDFYGLDKFNHEDAMHNDDGDNLTNIEEYFHGSSPLLADTDADGVNDDSDVFPTDNSEWLDSDGDWVGNNADSNDDNDLFDDVNDPFPLDSSKPQWVKVTLHDIPGVSDSSMFSISVDGLGDLNADGYDDFIVGREGSGYAKVYSGFDATILHDLTGPDFSNYGEVVANIGDINGDFVNDFVVGAPITRQVFVYSGADGTELFNWSGDTSYGAALSPAGDVNNDGIPDVLIGARDEDVDNGFGSTITRAGSAEVRSGSDGSIIHKITGSNSNGHLGESVTDIGDINGDGYDDFALKTYTASSGYRVIVSIYSGQSGRVLKSIDGYYGTAFGTTLENMGDIDQDGINDLGIGCTECGTADNGYAQIWSGKKLDTVLADKKGEAWSRSGYTLVNVNDFNGDGTNDFLMSLHLGGAGKAWLVSGIDNATLYEFLPGPDDTGYGYGLGLVGDVNNDGNDDYVIGASGSGRVEVVTVLLDSDSDGVADDYDSFPLDETMQ